jgi:hypothetical protein
MNRDTVAHQLRNIPPGARRDLLRVLRSPSNLRADVIRHEQSATRGMKRR